MAMTYNSVLVADPPFFREFLDTDGEFISIERDASALPFMLEELISFGVVDIAIPADSLSTLALNSVSEILKRRVRVVDEDHRILKMDRSVRAPICDEFGLRRKGGGVTFNKELPKAVKSAVLCLEWEWYHYLLGLTHKLQVDVRITDLQESIRILRECSKSSEARATLATFAGLLSTYETHSVGVIQMIPSSSEGLAEVFEAFLEDTAYQAMSESFHELGFAKEVTTRLLRVGTLSKRLVRKKAFKDVVDYGSKGITAATQIPMPESDLGERLLEQRFLPTIVCLKPVLERARQAWSDGGPGFTPLDKKRK